MVPEEYLIISSIISAVLGVMSLIQSLLITKLRLSVLRLRKENAELRMGASDAGKLE